MNRMTVDYGIDLGTTNSAVAILHGTETEIFKNNEGLETTPSAVWLDKKNRLHVGIPAKNRLETDPDNAHSEFKGQMGKKQEYRFSHNGQSMLPEELSSEVIKSLKGDIMQRTGEELQAAVVTVPAVFELPGCNATKKAAQLAGLSMSPLLQEPVAAALTYGFQSESDNVYWMVYDFGGGTFDAAIVRLRDGAIDVVNHAGDMHLGGTQIDWAIVDELLIPAVRKENPSLKEFDRGNLKWSGAMAKLKKAAEECKITVSRADAAPIYYEMLCLDEKGNPVAFEYELSRHDVERLAEPFIESTINLCKQALSEKRLKSTHMEKLLLVGGTSQIPYLQERLLDSKRGLGIALDSRIDPLTVVARGAAIFAGTQRIPDDFFGQGATKGQYRIDLEYSPVGTDLEPLVGGKVQPPENGNLTGFTIEFVNTEAQPPWRSGKIALDSNGTFMTNVLAERGRRNLFRIELGDATGSLQEVSPDHFPYTPGAEMGEIPLIQSIGIGLADNSMFHFFEKGAPLPARKTVTRRTAVAVQRNQPGAIFSFPVLEGENRRADRNRIIGSLQIDTGELKRDIPEGSEVKIMLEVDESRLVRTTAYLPILDEEYQEVLQLEKKEVNLDALKSEIEAEKKRLEQQSVKVRETHDRQAEQILQRIENQRMLHQVEAAFAAANADPDAGDESEKRLLELQIALDEVEAALEWPAKLTEAEQSIEDARKVVENFGDDNDKTTLNTLERETRQAMTGGDVDILRRKIHELDRLYYAILMAQPAWWAYQLDMLCEEENKSKMRDPGKADQLIADGRRAVEREDFASLRAAVGQLMDLLPMAEQQKLKRGAGSILI